MKALRWLILVALTACAKDSTGAGPGGGGSNPLAGYIAAPPGPAWSGSATAVTVGEAANCLLASDGTAWCWGNRFHAGIRVDDGIRSYDPNRTSEWYADSICRAHTAAGQLPGWPCNVLHPVRVATKTFVALHEPINDGAPCGVDASGGAFCWDQGPYLNLHPDSVNAGGLAYCGRTFCLFSPQPVRTSQLIRDYLPAGANCALSTTGAVLCSGGNSYNLLGNVSTGLYYDTLVAVAGAPASTALAVAPSAKFACALASSSKIYCWGWNESSWGVGVDATGNQIRTPSLINSTLTYKSVAAALWTACGLTTAGAAYCWGDGGGGKLGWGGNGFSFAPTAVTGSHTFTAITAGPGHFCALDGGGAAWCWGNNYSGELGVARAPCDGATFCASSPVQVAGGLTFRQLSAGVSQTCGVTTSNEVYCWGSTQYGRLGPSALSTTFVAAPVKITP